MSCSEGIEPGSLLFHDQQVWTPDNLAELHNVIEALPNELPRALRARVVYARRS